MSFVEASRLGDLAPPEADREDAPGFARLRRLLAAARALPDDARRVRAARTARRAALAPAFERAALNYSVPATVRLAQLAALQRLAAGADYPARDRQDLTRELDRYGMRILYGERVVEAVLAADAPPERRAAALLTLAARGQSPEGACAKAVLEPAKALLAAPDMQAALAASPLLRQQLVALLETAEAVSGG